MRFPILLLAIFMGITTPLSAQITVEVIVLGGESDSDCSDLIGSPDHIWSVKINEQDWTTYGVMDNGVIRCEYESTPRLQYSSTASCPANLGTIEICFRAFENDPNIFSDPCGVEPSNCAEEICQEYPIEATTHTLAIPNGASAEGELQFEISTLGSFVGDTNDLPCDAIDLGILNVGGQVGDATLGQFNNYCGTKTPGEPDPGDFSARWRNNVGVWLSFTTGNEPIHRLQVLGTSDPENTGDPMQLQVGVFTSNFCNGTFEYLGGSGPSNIDFNFDEFVQLDCGPNIQPNTTYYIVVDGVDDTPEQKNGIFGLQVQAAPLLPNEIDATLCFGDRLELSDLGLSYDGTGNFQDTVNLSSGCDTIIHANITVLEELIVEINQLSEATEEGRNDGLARAVATGGTGDYTYLWSDANREQSNGSLVGGETVSVTVTDSNNCEAMASLFVEFLRPITPSIVNDSLRCFGDNDGELVISATEGRPPYAYVWEGERNDLSGMGILRSEGETVILPNLPAGNYSITFSDNIGETTVIGTVTQPRQLQLEVMDNQAASCFGFCDGRLQVNLEGGTLPYTYDTPRGNFDLITFSDLCAGAFDLTVTDGNSCRAVFDLNIEEPEEFIATAEIQQVACFGGTDGAINISTNGDPIAYTWDNGENTANLDSLSAGNYTLTLTNADNCMDTLTLTITQPNAPLETRIEVTDVISCYEAQDGGLLAIVEGPADSVTYAWNTGQDTPTLNQLSPDEYRILVTNQNGCVASDSFILTQPDELVVGDFFTQNIGCTDELQVGYIQLQNVEGGTMPYEYSIDGIRFGNQARIENLFEGVYTATVRDGQDCELDIPFEILPPPDVQVTLGGNQLIKLGERIELAATSNIEGVEYEWSGLDSLNCDNCDRVEIMPISTSTYSVSVTDPATLCMASAVATISISKEREVYIPNVFSPNSDGLNDYFTVFGGKGVQAVRSLQVFDRSGSLLYVAENLDANNPTLGWDGQRNGKTLNPTIFVYFAEVEFIDGSIVVFEGDVALMR